MAFNWYIIRKTIYGIVKSPNRGLVSLTMYDEQGNETIEPTDATRFFATFSSQDADIETFTLLVAIRDNGQSSFIDVKTPELRNEKDFNMVKELLVHIRRAVGLKEGIKITWQDFDKVIDPREEAVNNIKESKDVGKLFGTTKSSFQRIGEAKLIIRHTDTVNEEKHGARTRHIKAIFIENKQGERFVFPHAHMTGARAFARHVSNGGNNHDTIAERIYSLSEDYIGLRRSSKHLRLHEGTETWINGIRESMNKINRKLKSMHGPKGYSTASQELLGESAIIDVNAIKELHEKLIETCQCDADDQLHGDLNTAAKYISAMPAPQITAPLEFTWNRQPSTTSMGDDASSQLYNQIMELSAACANSEISDKLANIAEMISCGTQLTDENFNLVKEAFSSGLSYQPKSSDVPEEREFDEYLNEFDTNVIFKAT